MSAQAGRRSQVGSRWLTTSLVVNILPRQVHGLGSVPELIAIPISHILSLSLLHGEWWLLPVHMWMFTCGCSYMNTCGDAHMYGSQRLASDIFFWSLSTLYIEAGSLIINSASLASQMASGLLSLPRERWDYRQPPSLLGINVCVYGRTLTGPYACIPSNLLIKPST